MITVLGHTVASSPATTGSTFAIIDFGSMWLDKGDVLIAAVIGDSLNDGAIQQLWRGSPTNLLYPWGYDTPGFVNNHSLGSSVVQTVGWRRVHFSGVQPLGSCVCGPVPIAAMPADYAKGVVMAVRGLDVTWGASGYYPGFRAMDNDSDTFETAPFVIDPTDRELLILSGGMMYGDPLADWTRDPHADGGVRVRSTEGGAIGFAGKGFDLVWEINTTDGPLGGTPPRVETDIPVGALEPPSMVKETIQGIFAGPTGGGFLIGAVGF